MKPVVVERHSALIPHAQVQWTSETGHAPFWDEADAFNNRLREFAAQVRNGVTAQAV